MRSTNNKKVSLKKSVGLCTVYGGYNYGSSLQAFALLTVLGDLGFDVRLLSTKGSLLRGRDVRWQKFLWLFISAFIDRVAFINYIRVHTRSLKKTLTGETKNMFLSFESHSLTPLKLRKRQLRALGELDEYVAFICGSDQIWKVNSPYINPMFFLRFAPKFKRIAYAPSFGGSSPLDMNKKRVAKYIKEINFLSVREESGKELISLLTARNAKVVLDPTLLLDSSTWQGMLSQVDTPPQKDYVLLYFLDAPSEEVIQKISAIRDRYDYSFVCVRYNHFKFAGYVEYIDAGPMEFVSLVSNSKLVVTDSYHGMLFSINLEIPFNIFSRQYGSSSEQSARIVNFLSEIDEIRRLDPEEISLEPITVRLKLEQMRECSIQFLKKSLESKS